MVILSLFSQVVLLAPYLVVVFALVLIAVRHQRIFLTLFTLLTALQSTRDFAPSLGMTFSGISVYSDDLFTVVCATAGLARIGRWRLSWIPRTAILVFAALVGLGVITWISTYGIQIGTNCWRPQLLIVALLVYTTTRPRAWSWNDLWVIIVAPATVVAFASMVGILMHGFGSSSSTVLVNGVMTDSRPVLSPDSLLMLIGLWLTVFSVGKWNVKRTLLVLLLGSMVFLTQIRSVWVAAIVGMVVWWLAPRIRGRGSSSGMGGPSRTLLVFFVAPATAIIGLSLTAVRQSSDNTVTFLWRVARWSESMNIPRSWSEWLVGSAFGPTPASTPTLFPTSAHSLYVNTVEIVGFIGLGAILCLVIAVGRAHVPPSIGPLGLVVCFTFLSYGVTYQLPAWAWMLAGLLLASTRVGLTSDTGVLIHAKAHCLDARDHAKDPFEASYGQPVKGSSNLNITTPIPRAPDMCAPSLQPQPLDLHVCSCTDAAGRLGCAIIDGIAQSDNEPADDDDHEVPLPRTGHSRCSDPREQLTDDQTR